MPKLDDTVIADRIKEVINDKRLKSIRAFSIAINVDPSYFSKILKAEKPITDGVIDGMVTKYGVSRDWLLHGKGHMYGADVPHGIADSTNSQAVVNPQQLLNTIERLTKNNERLLDTNEKIAETNRILANKLVAMDIHPTAAEHEATLKEMTILLIGLREYTADLGARVKKTDPIAEMQDLGKRVSRAKKDLEKRNTPSAVSR